MPEAMSHEIQLRPAFVAQLVLPSDLTIDEARRLQAIVMALATPCTEVDPEAWAMMAQCAGAG